MFWENSFRFSHPCIHSWLKCCNWPIVVGNDSMDLELEKSKIDNEDMLVMLWGSSLRLSQAINRNLVKCCNWPIIVGNDSMDL